MSNTLQLATELRANVFNYERVEIADKLDSLVASLSAQPVATDRLWQSIETLPYADDLVWLAHGDSIDGPRPMDTYDYDRYSYWAPCEPPSLGDLHLAAPPVVPADVDSHALNVATAIMRVVNGTWQPGGEAQIKAKIQCIVIDALNRRAVVPEVPKEPTDAQIENIIAESGQFMKNEHGYRLRFNDPDCSPETAIAIAKLFIAVPAAEKDEKTDSENVASGKPESAGARVQGEAVPERKPLMAESHRPPPPQRPESSTDANRLAYIAANGLNVISYSAFVIRTGGIGDLGDIRRYVDLKMSGAIQ